MHTAVWSGVAWAIGFLSRQTSGGKFIPQVDGLRFVAVLAVFVHHVNGVFLARSPGTLSPVLPVDAPPLSPEITNPDAKHLATDFLSRFFAEGYFGVPLFFAISGMIIAKPFAAARLLPQLGPRAPEAPGLQKYFLRRLTRLEPPYLINLLICYLAAKFFARDASEITPAHLVASMGYVHYFTYGISSTINSVAWSLEVEIQFYVIAPLLASVFSIGHAGLRRGVIVAAILAFGAMVQTIPPSCDYNPTLRYTVLSQLHWFLVGFLLTDLLTTRWKHPPATARSRLAWDLAAGGAWVAMWFMLAGQVLIQVLGPALIFITYAAAFRGWLWPWVFSRWFLYTVGGMCYTIYLYHMLIIIAAGRATFRFLPTDMVAPNLLFQTLLLGCFTLATCGVLFALFERPFMKANWPQRLLRRFQGLPAAPQAVLGRDSRPLPPSEIELSPLKTTTMHETAGSD